MGKVVNLDRKVLCDDTGRKDLLKIEIFKVGGHYDFEMIDFGSPVSEFVGVLGILELLHQHLKDKVKNDIVARDD